LIVGISCAHLSHTIVDPFTGGERFQMIKAYLSAEELVRYVDILPIPLDPLPTTWVPFIRTIAPPFQVVYARNPLIRTIFCYWGYEIDDEIIDRKTSGTNVRESMASNEDWKELVPPVVAEQVSRLAGVGRIKELALGKNF